MSTPIPLAGSTDPLTTTTSATTYSQTLQASGLGSTKPPEKAASPKRRTRYEIQWREAGDSSTWTTVAVIIAGGAHAAIRHWTDEYQGDEPLNGQTVRAVPISNITQVKLSLQTQTKLAFS